MEKNVNPTLTSGIGLRSVHLEALLSDSPKLGFLEAHTENFLGGGKQKHQFLQLAERYPISLHGVGLSLGRSDALDKAHLSRSRRLIDQINPVLVSEHLSWCAFQNTYVPDLLPFPLTHEALAIVADHVDEMQNAFGRQILVENLSHYMHLKDMQMSEPEFMQALAERTGCGILLDVNNVAVSAFNIGFDAYQYLEQFDKNAAILEFHLAGYQINPIADNRSIYIDTHGCPVYPEVWELYAAAIARFGHKPTLIEWDTDIPDLSVLLAEADKADQIMATSKTAGHQPVLAQAKVRA